MAPSEQLHCTRCHIKHPHQLHFLLSCPAHTRPAPALGSHVLHVGFVRITAVPESKRVFPPLLSPPFFPFPVRILSVGSICDRVDDSTGFTSKHYERWFYRCAGVGGAREGDARDDARKDARGESDSPRGEQRRGEESERGEGEARSEDSHTLMHTHTLTHSHTHTHTHTHSLTHSHTHTLTHTHTHSHTHTHTHTHDWISSQGE